MHKDQLEKLEDFSTYRENRSRLEVSCQENPWEEKPFKGIHNSDRQRFCFKNPSPVFAKPQRNRKPASPSLKKTEKPWVSFERSRNVWGLRLYNYGWDHKSWSLSFLLYLRSRLSFCYRLLACSSQVRRWDITETDNKEKWVTNWGRLDDSMALY